jgi:mono/diheme cytochrome c family protein
MFRRAILFLCLLGFIGGVIFWILSAPRGLDKSLIAELKQQGAIKSEIIAKGEQIFWASGCSSCHVDKKVLQEAKTSEDEDVIKTAKLTLSGGEAFKTPFGTFYAPNISPSEQGIAHYTLRDFALALTQGVSPKRQHFYPAFPYSSYKGMEAEDITALYYFMKTLPESETPNKPHQVAFPFDLRRGLGLWMQLNFYYTGEVELVKTNPEILRGKYLVENLAHCGECHTPRDALGGLEYSRWMAGGKAFEGAEKVPNISPSETGIAGWSEEDIITGLQTGFTPEFDSFGSSMVSVQENMARLPKEDLAAIAAYLKAIPPQER